MGDYDIQRLERISKERARVRDARNEASRDRNQPVVQPTSQVGGSHYESPIDPDKYIAANNLTFREGNIVKYVTRHRKKNGLEDLLKARDYLDRLIKEYK